MKSVKGSKRSNHASLIKKIPALISAAVQASWNISSQYLGQKTEDTFAERVVGLPGQR